MCSRRLQQRTFSDAFFSWPFKVLHETCLPVPSTSCDIHLQKLKLLHPMGRRFIYKKKKTSFDLGSRSYKASKSCDLGETITAK